MHAISFTFGRHAGVLAGLALILGGVHSLGATASKQTDAFPVFDSFIKVSGKAPSITGNPAAYAERFRSPDNGSYGIEALHVTKEVDKDTTMEIDGKALTGAEDYLGKVRFTKNEVGSVEVGYKSFRTFYDGIGGFFPLGKTWKPLGNEELHTDRATFWADVRIALPNKPVFHVRYSDQRRDGRKDTTIWGDTDFSGIPIYNVSSLNPVTANKKLVANYILLDEQQKIFEFSVKHTVGNTDLEFELVNNRTNSDDKRTVWRYPGELRPYPLLSTGQPAFLVDPSLANNKTFGFDQQMSNADNWTYTGKFETMISEVLTVHGGISYQEASAAIAGNRQNTLYINTATGLVTAVGGFVGATGRPPYSYKTDNGRTSEKVLTANLGFTYKPQHDLTIGLAFKGEDLDMSGHNNVTYNSNSIVQATGVVTPVNVAAANTSTRSEKSWIPELDVRYTGIAGVALYGTIDYRFSPGDETGYSGGVTTGGGAGAPVISFDKVDLNHAHYKVGASWTVSPAVTLRAETFYKDHENKFTGYGASLGGRYILGYAFHGYKLTAIYKPVATATFTTRYVGQTGTMDTTVDAGPLYESMDSKNHMFGETVDWTPNDQVYVQASVNVVFSTLQTAYPRAGLTGNDVLRNSDNNYVNGSVLAGFVVDKATDAQLEYTFYRADNYDPLTPPSAVPLGAGAKEYTVTAGVKHKLTDRMIVNAKVGYFDSQNDTTGGMTNFRGPLGYVSIDYAL
jgi:hypothetical protein